MEEIKPVVMERHEFEQRDSSKLKAFWQSRNIVNATRIFQTRLLHQMQKLLREALKEELQSAVMEKDELEPRLKKKTKADLWQF